MFFPFFIMGPTSGLFLNEEFYWSFTQKHKKIIKYEYIFKCEHIYVLEKL